MGNAGITEPYVILSEARQREVEESSHCPTAKHKRGAKILRLASLAQDDKSVRTPVIRNISNFDSHCQLIEEDAPWQRNKESILLSKVPVNTI